MSRAENVIPRAQMVRGCFLVFTSMILAVVLVAIGFLAGVGAMHYWPQVRRTVEQVLPPRASEVAQQQSREERAQLLWKIWDLLEQEYLEPESLDPQKMIYGAAAGMVSSLGDPHTVFVEPRQAEMIEENMRGSFEGIGATVNMTEGKLVISRLLPNSPALKVGLQVGDIILKVDDISLEGKTVQEAVSLIRGPRGTVVRLLIQRAGVAEPFLVPVTRDRVELPIVTAQMREDGFAYLRLSEFNAVSAQRVHAALEELLQQKPKGLILDLRDNPGGYLQMSVDVASEFLPKGALILTERERGKEPREFRVEGKGLATELPLVVLVNEGSASAAEIVAGAIKDNGRGALIGQKTYGKGSVQSTHRLDDGSSLRVTIAKWYLPGGENLDGQGITPDIEVSLTAEDMAAGRDPQLERAAAYLLHGE